MEHEEFAKIFETINNARETVRSFLDDHQQHIKHGKQRLDEELPLLNVATDIISRKWAIHLIWFLESKGPLRFNQFTKLLPNISTRSLSDTLKDLEEQKIVDRNISDDRPPKVFYSLTEKGKGFVELALLLVFYLNFP